NRNVLDAATLAWLHRMKREHEARVKLATSFGPDRRSTVLRMIGNLRGQVVEIFQDTASTTVLHSGERLPEFTLAYDRHSIEIDLRKIPGEAEGGPDYYRTAMATIDEVVAGRVREGIARDAIPHLSVFAFARLPLLVYLGSRLDDTVPTSIYQRHRATEEWSWPDPTAGAATFELTVDGAKPADEGLLVLNISGTIHDDELPSELSELPTYRITTKGPDPSPDAVDTPEVLQRFEAKVRELLAHLESTNKTIRRLHVFAAVPISAAVTLGRTTDPNVHPSLVLYDRVDHSYQQVLEVRP
ncbi:MAG TPA: SAVED domain-containing protein, partial [Acidimicrobiales bacterium]|nr:SAVED domain-containing protein [Acidimicrobiales bacterium]